MYWNKAKLKELNQKEKERLFVKGWFVEEMIEQSGRLTALLPWGLWKLAPLKKEVHNWIQVNISFNP